MIQGLSLLVQITLYQENRINLEKLSKIRIIIHLFQIIIQIMINNLRLRLLLFIFFFIILAFFFFEIEILLNQIKIKGSSLS